MIDLKRIKYGKMKKEKLTKNQQTVLSLLEQSNEPLKAYTILSGTQKKGIKAPTQVYRALDKLIEIGKVHKIESKNWRRHEKHIMFCYMMRPRKYFLTINVFVIVRLF